MSTSFERVPTVSRSACESFARPALRLLLPVARFCCSMLAERSSSTMTVSGTPPVSPSKPPAIGRVMTNRIAATANTRNARIRICRSRDSPLFMRCAMRRNIIAAHFTCRRRYKWIK